MSLRIPSRDELRSQGARDPEAIIDLVLKLFDQVATLTARVRQLEEKLAQNSSNSGKPPSSDRFNKPAPKSLRKPSRKRRGGQKGHPGHHLQMTDTPDVIKVITPEICTNCGDSLHAQPVESYDRRQVFDIVIKMVVTEHRAEIKTCRCGGVTRAPFEDGVTHRTQYGASIRALLVYMSQYQLIPYARTVEFVRDMTGHNISEGTLYNAISTCHENLVHFEGDIKDRLAQADCAGFDETGARCAGKQHWIHSACTSEFTLLEVDRHRGFEAMQSIGILPRFQGVAVHDYLKTYYRFTDCEHALCGAHIVRELVFLYEVQGRKWARRMAQLLLAAEAAADRARARGKTELDPRTIGRFEAAYGRLVTTACRSETINRDRTTKRGRIKQSKARNMAERLRDRRDDILRFLHDLIVPFTNNGTERTFRMVKTQQKISGGFRSLHGARIFCRTRSYVDTAKKHAQPILEALGDALLGQPWMPWRTPSTPIRAKPAP